jgi:hypothetical protein
LPDPCHERTPWPDAGDPNACTGVCVIAPNPKEWPRPELVWIGPKGQAPPCPDHAPDAKRGGYADPVIPDMSCGCTCDPPTGSCEPPKTITAHADPLCAPGAAQTSFNPPPMSWDGSCTAYTQIQGGALCGAVYCAQSLTFDALTIHEVATCTPQKIPMPRGPAPYYTTEGVICAGEEQGQCTAKDGGGFCVATPPPGFRVCTFLKGDEVACDPDYSDRFILYDDPVPNDGRSCTDCACGPPIGSMCAGCVATYADASCSVFRACNDVSSDSAACHAVQPPGAPLLSKQAFITYTPGTCEPSGGEVTGTVEGVDPFTFCCLPLD